MPKTSGEFYLLEGKDKRDITCYIGSCSGRAKKTYSPDEGIKFVTTSDAEAVYDLIGWNFTESYSPISHVCME